ncbi:MAG TPA: aminoglycoside phosphotransferase family protein [Longimicrobium sp.]|nr:aminoglycoside phosphotransferase family protein [Longimicrobium sp.]
MIHLDRQTIKVMMAPAVETAVRGIARVGAGLTNTTYRVTATDGAAYGLRLYAAGRAALDLERWLLPALSAAIPVPDVLCADAGGAHPYLVYHWIEGVTLNECRRDAGPAALMDLAEPLGRLLAAVAAAPGVHGPDLDAIRIDARLARAAERLRTGLARERLGAALADGLRARFAGDAARLQALEHPGGLVHGDFGGRNVLVRRAGEGGWEISGVIDWESAGLGSALWDVGSLFRYPQRYSPEFRAAFKRGYRAAHGALPDDWFSAARLLDSTRLVSILDEPRELPSVFAECRQLIAALIGC